MRTRDPDAKRDALLAAGVSLAHEHGLGQVSVNRVVATAGVAKGTFFHHFGDRAGFLVELHRRFHDRLTADIEAAIGDLRPGRDRLLRAATAYLDGCRRDRGTRALLVEARAEPAVRAEIVRRNAQFTALAAADFVALHRDNAEAAAQLWVVMAAEVAVAESARDAVIAPLRDALAGYLPGRGPA
ncbi:TetR/AcrR family transcriptional regulator [Actinoplanes sp. NPDC026623]|uniref:TetR/AcrR family transcriptional regulator n=1 Tax=Actinoplanes sp. NPDC026623 TaxID=3155610 RepID=UPI0033CD866F